MRTASLPLEASCQGPGSRHLQGRHPQRQPSRQTRCTSSSGARQQSDQTAIDAEVEAKKAVPKSEEAERMRQLSGHTTRTRKVFVGGLPPSVDETAFRWAGTFVRGLQAAPASQPCRFPSTVHTSHKGTMGSLARHLGAWTMPCLLQEVL